MWLERWWCIFKFYGFFDSFLFFGRECFGVVEIPDELFHGLRVLSHDVIVVNELLAEPVFFCQLWFYFLDHL
jgi:hypothetical protein